MSDLGAPLTIYVIPKGADQGDPLAQESETLGMKFELAGQQYGLLISQETLRGAGIQITAPYGSAKRRLQLVAEQLAEGTGPPRRA